MLLIHDLCPYGTKERSFLSLLI